MFRLMELFRSKITRPMNNTPGPVKASIEAVTLEQHQHQGSHEYHLTRNIHRKKRVKRRHLPSDIPLRTMWGWKECYLAEVSNCCQCCNKLCHLTTMPKTSSKSEDRQRMLADWPVCRTVGSLYFGESLHRSETNCSTHWTMSMFIMMTWAPTGVRPSFP